MIDSTFVKAIQEGADTKTATINGKQYSTKPVYNVPLPNEPRAAALNIETLTGLVDYCSNMDIDGLERAEQIIHVVSYHEVQLISKIKGELRQREAFVAANCKGYAFPFGKFMKHQEFMIAIQALFQDFGDRAKVMKVIGNVKVGADKTSIDDGVTQRVTAAAGVALVQDVAVPNPVLLKPWRTFPEIDQPPSNFVLRVEGDDDDLPTIALFEADGGLWKREAVKSIREYLVEHTKEIAILA